MAETANEVDTTEAPVTEGASTVESVVVSADDMVVPMSFDEFDVERLVLPPPQPNKEGGFGFMPKYKAENGAMTELVVQMPSMRVVFPIGPGLKKTLTPTSPLNASLATDLLPASYHDKASKLTEKLYEYLCQYKDMLWPEDGLSDEQVRKKVHKVFASGINKKGEMKGGYMPVKMDPKLQDDGQGGTKANPNPAEMYYVDADGNVIDDTPIERLETIYTQAMQEGKQYVSIRPILALTSGYTMASWGGLNWRMRMGEVQKVAKPKYGFSKTNKRKADQVSRDDEGSDVARVKTESDASAGINPLNRGDEEYDQLDDSCEMAAFE